MSAVLCLNRNAKKTLYDSIRVVKKEEGFSVTYSNDIGPDGENMRTNSTTIELDSAQELFDYLELTLDLIMEDLDDTPFLSIDLMMRSFPIICLKPNEKTKQLILKSFAFWRKF